MAPHGFPPIKNKPEGLSKPKTTVTYQTGVDVLGFPIYMEHKIYTISTEQKSKFHKTKSVKASSIIEQNLIKQH